MGTPAEPTPVDPATAPWLFALGHWDLTEPGAAAYRGARFLIAGAPRRLLCRLVRARGLAVPIGELKAALGNPFMEDVTLRGHAHDLRTTLRRHLAGLEGFPADPVPCADRGDAGGYRLAAR
jgi:hypothetical protein